MNIKAMLPDVISYWETTGQDGYGERTYLEPVDIDSRWEDKQEEVTGIDGTLILCQAIIYTDLALEVDGLVFNGPTDTLTESRKSNPEEVLSYRVKNISKSRSIIGNKALFKIYLSTRFSGR